MIDFSDVRIFFCTTPTNMNYSFDHLMGRAQEIFEQDPCSGHLFLFPNRCRDRITILFWDRGSAFSTSGLSVARLSYLRPQTAMKASSLTTGNWSGCWAGSI